MKLHMVVGAGPVGTATALHLAAAGETVRLVSRSGGPAADGVESHAADATDAGRLAAIAAGAAVSYNCASNSWTYVPDIAATLAVLDADDRAWGHAWHVPTSQEAFGIKPTPMAAALAATATWWRSQGRATSEGSA